MDAPDEARQIARHELVLVVAVLVALSRFVAREDAIIVAALLPVAVVLAGLGVLPDGDGRGRHFEALLIPAVLTGGSAAAIQLVPAGLGMLLALASFAILLDRLLALEMRLLAQVTGTSDADRSRVRLFAVVTAFVAFTGIAALVPGGLAEPRAPDGAAVLTEGWLLVLAIEDAVVALVLGYRVSAFRYGTARDAARSALTYAIVIAVAAGSVRAINLPRLVAPAVLTLVFYLWDAFHGSAPARRRDPRFVWETILLVVLAVVVVAWNLRLRA